MLHLVAQLIARPEGSEFEFHCGLEFFILYFSLALYSLQLVPTHANEINHAIFTSALINIIDVM